MSHRDDHLRQLQRASQCSHWKHRPCCNTFTVAEQFAFDDLRILRTRHEPHGRILSRSSGMWPRLRKYAACGCPSCCDARTNCNLNAFKISASGERSLLPPPFAVPFLQYSGMPATGTSPMLHGQWRYPLLSGGCWLARSGSFVPGDTWVYTHRRALGQVSLCDVED